MKNTKKVAKNTFILSLTEVIIKGIGFAWILILANQLSPEGYGTYSVINSIIAIFALFPEMGSGIIVIREIAKGRDSNKIISSALLIILILSSLTFASIILLSQLLSFSQVAKISITIAALTLVFSTIRSTSIFYFDGKEKFKVSSILNTLNSVLMLSFGLGLLLLGHGVVGVFFGMLIGTVTSTIISWTVFLKHKKFSFSPTLKSMLKITKTSLPLGLAGISFMIYTKIDSIMINEFTTITEVAKYNSATPFIIATIQLLNVPFAVAAFPTLTKIYKTDLKRFKKAFIKSMLFVIGWSIPVNIFIFFFADTIIPLFFNEKYNQAVPVLKYLSFVIPFASLSAILYKVLIIVGKEKLYLGVSVLAAVVNVLLNLFLIPTNGIIGAAVASVITQIFVVAVYAILVVKLISHR